MSIDLPIVEDTKEPVSGREEKQEVGSMHLLVAEDNDLNWEIFRELVSEQGITCDHAKNGKECVEMLKSAPVGTYSAVLMDVHMPVMNGYEATKAIRSLDDEKRNKIPIVAMTADAFAEDVQPVSYTHLTLPTNREV